MEEQIVELKNYRKLFGEEPEPAEEEFVVNGKVIHKSKHARKKPLRATIKARRKLNRANRKTSRRK